MTTSTEQVYTSITVSRYQVRCLQGARSPYPPPVCFLNESAIQCPHTDDTGDIGVLLPHFVENGSGPAVDTWRENDEH